MKRNRVIYLLASPLIFLATVAGAAGAAARAFPAQFRAAWAAIGGVPPAPACWACDGSGYVPHLQDLDGPDHACGRCGGSGDA